MKRVLLVDGNSIMNRAFYGLPLLTNNNGEYTNAIYGFLNILFKTMEDRQTDSLIVSFDLKGGTFRNEIFKEYKGNRKGMPEELRPQMKAIKKILKAMNIGVKEMQGFEADDIIGTLSCKLEEKGEEIVILSGDRDLLQLATDKVGVVIPKTSKGKTTYEFYNNEVIKEVKGLGAKDLIEVKGLMGDTSDNIPGIPGVGEKTAIKLIKKYGSIEKVYENREELTKKLKENVSTYYEQALMSRKLGRIILDAPIEINESDYELKDMFNKDSYALFREYQLNTLLSKFENLDDGEVSVEEKTEEKEINLKKVSIAEFKNDLKKAEDVYYSHIEDKGEIIFMYSTNKEDFCYLDSGDSKEFFDTLYANKSVKKWTYELKKQLLVLKVSEEIDFDNVIELTLINYILDPAKRNFSVYAMLMSENEVVADEDDFFGKGKKRKSLSDFSEEELADRLKLILKSLIKVAPKLLSKLKENDLEKLYLEIELPLLFVLYKMELRGIKVDGEALKDYSKELKEKIKLVEKEIFDIVGEEFNVASPKQLGVILFEKMELPFAKKTKTGYSTSAEVLEKLVPYHPIASLVLEYRQLSKLKSTYTDSLYEYIEEDGRIHSSFNQMVTSTGRISSTDPNLQNIPIRTEMGRKIRKVFVADEGKVFVDADYSQIELRILAHLSKDETMIHAFANNDDIHTITASNVFHVAPEEVDSLMRRKAKAVNFGIIYGISAFGLTRDLDIPMYESKKYIDKYFEKYASIKEFLDSCKDSAKEKGYAQTIFGRKRKILELKSKNFMQRSFGERIAMNTPIQGSAADIIKIAMIKVEEKLREGNFESKLILQIHDELLVEAPKNEAEKVKKLLVETMENCVSLSVPLSVEANTGENWDESH